MSAFFSPSRYSIGQHSLAIHLATLPLPPSRPRPPISDNRMTFPSPLRRAALLGAALALVACDVASFVNDPKPILEQTWNLPASSTSIAVSKLLPATVSIYSTPGSNPPDSSAFQMSFNGVVFLRRVGDDCGQCQTLNGTTAVKPAFVLAAGASSALPQNVIASGALLGATVNYTLTNNLSFDPLRVNTVTANPQGYMIVVVRSASQVLGRDSVNGATTPLPSGATLSRSIPVGAGAVTAAISVDLTVASPLGDHNEFINANGTLNMAAAIANLRVGNVQINVPGTAITNQPNTLDLAGLDKSITDHVQSATLEMTIDNPWTVAGNLNVDFTAAATTIAKTVALPGGTTPPAAQVRTVALTASDMQQLFGKQVVLSIGGGITSPGPVIVSPKQRVSIANRLILIIRTGS
jgi:hypothetical protein